MSPDDKESKNKKIKNCAKCTVYTALKVKTI